MDYGKPITFTFQPDVADRLRDAALELGFENLGECGQHMSDLLAAHQRAHANGCKLVVLRPDGTMWETIPAPADFDRSVPSAEEIRQVLGRMDVEFRMLGPGRD
jgi:hypothetical protein